MAFRTQLLRAALVLASIVACKPDQGPPAAAVADPPTPNAIAQTTDAPPPTQTGGGVPTDAALASAALAAVEVEASTVDGTAVAPAPTTEVKLPKQRVLILGDSLAATAFGVLLEKRLDEHPQVECFRRAKSASGLARPDFFDWMKESRRQVSVRDPDLVVLIIGGNDGQDLTTKAKKNKRVRWKDADWAAAYRRRVQQFLVGLVGPDRKVLWLGLPRMGPASFERKLALIRSIQQEVMSGMGEAGRYLDTIAMTSDAQGGLLRQARVGGRKRPQAIRADDGIHFTMAGSKYFADKVYPEVLATLGLAAVD